MTAGVKTFRLRQHNADATGADWCCSCGKTAANTAGGLEQHRQRAAKAAWGRLNDMGAGALISLDVYDREVSELLWEWNRRSGALRPFAAPGYDGYGCLRAQLDLGAVYKALDAGELDNVSGCSTHVLRVALALAGHGTVGLGWPLGGDLSVSQRRSVLRAVAERLHLDVAIAEQ